MSAPVIAAVGHVALEVADLDQALATATEIMGLRESERGEDGWVYLTHGATHHSIQYRQADADGVHHIGLEAADPEAIVEIRQRLAREGIAVDAERPFDPMLPEGFVFTLPEGFAIEVYVGMPAGEPAYGTPGVRPIRFGHVNLTVREPDPIIDVLRRVLDFRTSDIVAGGAFLRCNVDHHGVAVLPGPGVLHHHAWEVGSVVDLARLGDRLHDLGLHLAWGPLRHGAGRNVAAYFREPAGAIVEYYSDMERIYDEFGHEPVTWSMEGQDWYSLWSPGIPDGFGDLGVPPVPSPSR
ncbi:MAG TPA: VOC family protein [Solirubrobacterales bacterium]|nr:VOC family protein [Solirubrobacterales bacterium]